MSKLFSGAIASIYVSSMDDAIGFYVNTLQLKLINRIDNEWAEIDVGNGFIIGLHPANPVTNTAPGMTGSINIELQINKDLSLDDVVANLKNKGVLFKDEIQNYEHVRLVSLYDYDKNVIIIGQNI
ncbi:hypothetical protein FNO01nite_16060 [Flavobacterium noncentrifugens]|uniref:Glyoxalase-like domain-containing protein n=1 Tax=Flavobacterium noncentrifugens TaxID=1128970 RepID=A0A1G8WI02_9FLAO|nr:VOC family protein [Flavobacterium noncentrifugens]GEP50934.1 hypothetical protein FNO01nite_16060 [Flavobacterium noncentrifugens]SDJ77747.1 Glyoxalase-like domain-containing protein [Flavobacterium noncentrifugens]